MLTSYENCWALRHKIQDLIENGTTAGLLDIRSMSDGKWNHRSIPSIFSNHWHQSITLLCSWTLLSCGDFYGRIPSRSVPTHQSPRYLGSSSFSEEKHPFVHSNKLLSIGPVYYLCFCPCKPTFPGSKYGMAHYLP